MINAFVNAMRRRARKRRTRIFLENFSLSSQTRILDIGSEDGANIASVLKTSPVQPENVYIADIDEQMVLKGREQFGFSPVVIPESGRKPFEDSFFDIVYCSSVVEHATIPKSQVWSVKSGAVFKETALKQQQEFAREISRIGKRYFVQTPYKWFPIESHTWLPFVGYLPRCVLISILAITNRIWVKKTTPDWYLLSARQLRRLFPEARIMKERFMGLTKSIMAIKG
jgi:SAM-dependent methyltransferase